MKDIRNGRGRRELPPINENIKAPRLQLIDEHGENLGVLSKSEALLKARDAGLDLVMLAESGGMDVPVAKIMDYGKAAYEKKKKEVEAKKKQKAHQLKEVKFRPKIGEHDFTTKINQAIKFLNEGKKLKVTLMFRGREMVTRYERGSEMFTRVEAAFANAGLQTMQEKESKAGPFWSRMYYVKK